MTYCDYLIKKAISPFYESEEDYVNRLMDKVRNKDTSADTAKWGILGALAGGIGGVGAGVLFSKHNRPQAHKVGPIGALLGGLGGALYGAGERGRNINKLETIASGEEQPLVTTINPTDIKDPENKEVILSPSSVETKAVRRPSSESIMAARELLKSIR
jgi:hypothetical protein